VFGLYAKKIIQLLTPKTIKKTIPKETNSREVTKAKKRLEKKEKERKQKDWILEKNKMLTMRM
jgi:hypothetical protein